MKMATIRGTAHQLNAVPGEHAEVKPFSRMHVPVASCRPAGLLTISPIVSLIHLHPYQMTYFNSFVGGLRGANENYETDYWLTSYREAMEWVNMEEASGTERAYTVLIAGSPNPLETVRSFKASNIAVRAIRRGATDESLPDDVDFFIATSRDARDQQFSGSPIVHTVGRDGAVFSVVRAREVKR